MKNPFRTKILIFVDTRYTLIIRVPFFGKATIKQEKSKLIKGYKVNTIMIDEAMDLK